jgi:cephalosporin hydroxylase
MDNDEFTKRNSEMIAAMSRDAELQERTNDWCYRSAQYEYTYHFTWLGRPIIQYPQDVVAMQEIIWRVQPDVIIETGIARGGSLVFHASMLQLVGKGHVLGIDIDIREHNRVEIEKHLLHERITMIQGSSIDPQIADQARAFVRERDKGGGVIVILDSNHTHEHVLRELELYSSLVTKGSYLVVMDTAVDNFPDELFKHRPWKKGNSPMSALREFLGKSDRFAVDEELDQKLLITVAPKGYLKCLR